MPYTLGQAAQATGKQKSTILDAIRSGKISAIKGERGQWQIDPAELHRVYPANAPNVVTEQNTTPINPDRTELLEAKIKFLEREVAQLERTQEDLRDDRDHWRRQATALLTHQPSPVEAQATPPTPTEQQGKGKLWQKLFGKMKP